MARTPSTKTLALRALSDSKTGAATKWAALQAARPYLAVEEYSIQLRKLAATARAKVLRLCLLELAALERGEQSRADAPAPELDENLRRILTAPRGAPATNSKTDGVDSTEPVTPAAPVADRGPSSVPLRPHSERQPDVSVHCAPRPAWWKTSTDLEEPGDGELFVRNLAARRQREMGDTFALETAGVSFAALQSASLAAEKARREKPPKRRYASMPTCGDSLND